MGFNAIVTPDDLKKGELINPGWVPVEYVDYTEKEASTDASTNIILTFKVLDGPFKGVTANKLFNEKALGFGKALWPILGVPYEAEKGYALNDQILKAKIGTKLQIYVARGESNKGNAFNDVKDFRPLSV